MPLQSFPHKNDNSGMAAMEILVRDRGSDPASPAEAFACGAAGVALVLGLIVLVGLSLRPERTQLALNEPASTQRAVVPLMPDLPELP